jgi:microcompartment protein CcmK/EutM
MRIAELIGTVTLSRVHPSLVGQHFVIGVPFSLSALKQEGKADGEDVVILDGLQAGCGSRIGFSEGVEAAMPFFPERKPVDAYCACILDHINVHGRPGGGSHETRKPVRNG